MTPEQHIEIVERLARIEAAVTGVPELEKRVGKLENQRAWLLGASAVVGAAAKHFLPCVLALLFAHGIVAPKTVHVTNHGATLEPAWV